MPALPDALPFDRRPSRTQRALRDALLSLTLHKDYDAITVEELCEIADVGRSTFYEHFRGKDDLKRSWVRTMDGHPSAARSSGTAFSFSLPLLRHAREHLRHIRALGLGRGREVAIDALSALVLEQVRRELTVGDPKPSRNCELALHFYTGAFMSVLTRRLASGAHAPPEEVDAEFRKLATHGHSAGDI